MGEVLKAPPIVAELLGNVLEGRYRVDAVLAVGGMSCVFRGHHLRLRRDIAIKVMDPGLGPGASTRFLREAESAARLDHPNCITVHDFGVTSSELSFMVMPLLDGQTLRARPAGRWDAARATRLGVEVLRGLEHAHGHGVIHRDLKPENVFMALEPDGTKVAKIVDFGLAKVIRGSEADSTTTMTGLMAGTPAYMSPEQALGMVVDERADLYSVGMILYELLAGKLPFAAEDGVAALRMQVHEALPTLPADVPAPLAAIVAQLTAKERDLRPTSAREVLDALEAFLRGDGHTMLAPSVRRPTPQHGAYPAVVVDDATPHPSGKSSRADVTWSDHQDAPRSRPRPSRGWLLWLAAGVAATSAVTVVTLTLAQPQPPQTEVATALEDAPQPDAVETPSPAVPDASKLLALVNDPELAAREGWSRRHELLDTIARLDATARVDTHLQVSLDLLQAAQSPTPCRTFAATLDAITLGGAASYTDVLRQARVPEGAIDQPDCAPLADRLGRLQGSEVVIVDSSDVEDEPELALAKPAKKPKAAKAKPVAKTATRTAPAPASVSAPPAEPAAKPKKSLIPKLDDDLRPPA